MQDLLVKARARVEGKNILFVSNRCDPDLKKKLEKTFKVSLDWTEVEKIREIQALCGRVARGRYNQVWVQTSFISHKTDQLIKSACRSAGVTYLPVNKGRPNAIASMLLGDSH